MNHTFVIGVDGGGSKTAAVVLDQTGQVWGRAESGSSNYHNVGLDSARSNLLGAMTPAAEQAGITLNDVSAVTWALAGVERQTDRQLFARLAAELLPGVPVQVEHDTLAALMGGLGGRQGIVLIAGTGMCAYGEHQGRRARAGGWGYFLDHGSAHSLAQEALRAVGLAHDGSIPPTRLTERILETLELPHPTDIVGWVYRPGRPPSAVAALAPVVLEEAERGDLAAVRVVARGAEALVTAVETVARKIELWGTPFHLVFAGGLMQNQYYRGLLTQGLQARVPGAHPVLPRFDPAVGAGLVSLASLGYEPVQPEPLPVQHNGIWSSEQRNLLTLDIDRHSPQTQVGLLHVGDEGALNAVGRVLPAVAEAVTSIATRMAQGGRLIYVGAGSSGRLGIIDAAECRPTFNAPPEQVIGIMAGGPAAFTRSIEGAEDDPAAGRGAIQALDITPLDSVVGIAASGRTPFVLGALDEARERGALTIALVTNLPSPIASHADHLLAPLVGPEALTGSTRLKAGTAQKLVLNMLSTAVMIRLGKSYSNLMVDLRAENSKLQARALRIVAQACDVAETDASAALSASGGEVKTAIVSILAGCSPDEARRRLAHANGIVRRALEN